jgi:hypothetical protein
MEISGIKQVILKHRKLAHHLPRGHFVHRVKCEHAVLDISDCNWDHLL